MPTKSPGLIEILNAAHWGALRREITAAIQGAVLTRFSILHTPQGERLEIKVLFRDAPAVYYALAAKVSGEFHPLAEPFTHCGDTDHKLRGPLYGWDLSTPTSHLPWNTAARDAHRKHSH